MTSANRTASYDRSTRSSFVKRWTRSFSRHCHSSTIDDRPNLLQGLVIEGIFTKVRFPESSVATTVAALS